jgi:23S rRNA pseudouridine955/2504/2580 synthase
VPTLTVDRSEAGQRLDRYLRKVLPGMPTSHIFKLLRTRKVRLNGKRARGEQKVRAGDQVLIHMDEARFQEDTRRARPRATRMDFHLVFEDEHLLVVGKPPFLAVHPGAGHRGDSLIDQVHAYLEVAGGPAAFRPSLAHRLDRDTSGLVLVGKTVEVLQALGRMLKAGAVEKSYLALARGVPRPRKGTWEFEVKRRDVPGSTGGRRPSRGRKDAGGRTAYRVATTRKLERPRGKPVQVSLLALNLLTGRTHQIRSHLLQAGHPLAGDRRYGDRDFNRLLRERYGLKRQFLHAYRLILDHPVTGKACRWVDPYPDDLEPIARALRLGVPE